MAKLSAPEAFDREESRNIRSEEEILRDLSLPELYKIRTMRTYYSTPQKKKKVKSTKPELLTHRFIYFLFCLQLLYLVSILVVLLWSLVFPPWSGDTAGPLLHIYSILVTMARKIKNILVLLNQVWNKGYSGSWTRPMTPQAIPSIKALLFFRIQILSYKEKAISIKGSHML